VIGEQVLLSFLIYILLPLIIYSFLIFEILLTLLAHEIWTTLAGDGRVGTFIVRTSDPNLAEMNIFSDEDDAYVSYIPVIIDSKSKRNISPGERATLSFLRYMLYESKFIEAGDVIIIDAESALSTDVVQDYLFQHRVYPFVLPSSHHQLLNPCDNSFHSIFKNRYFRLISNINYGNIEIKEKLNLARQCFHGISQEIVAGMFRKCGLVRSDQSKRAIVSRLMCEGISSLEKRNQHHKICLLAFLQWVKANNLVVDLCPFRFNLDNF
jgi:hypothetical protein